MRVLVNYCPLFQGKDFYSIVNFFEIPILQDNQVRYPLKPLKENTFKRKCYLVYQQDNQGEFFPLITPELNQNILFLIEEIILILS